MCRLTGIPEITQLLYGEEKHHIKIIIPAYRADFFIFTGTTNNISL